MPRKDLGIGMTPDYVDMMLQGAKKRAFGRAIRSIALIGKRSDRMGKVQKLIDKGAGKANKGTTQKAKKKKKVKGDPYVEGAGFWTGKDWYKPHRRDKKH